MFDVKDFGANQEQPETSRLALWSLVSNEVLKVFKYNIRSDLSV